MKYTDQEISTLLQKKSTQVQGYNLLVYTYQEKMYWVIRRILLNHEDSDDVLQEVLLKLWTKLSSFNFESAIYTWLYRIAVNEALSFLRKKRRVLLLPIYKVEHELSKYIEQEGIFTGSDIELIFQQALLTLPEKQRIVFTIRYYDDLSFAEIAKVLKMSEGGVKSTYHIAAGKLKEKLDAH